ncbi:linear gramicidin synthase subunit d-like isoform x1 [Plakobranchus ocellatus]|uniref:Fatty acid synthase n=1 Tax=Plakobranchus ocellatus TaxID=259542 RepID=A0AAV3YRP6_9GAST|nr:linear gramicidin synthase subunit d-like isoform x1 [Plakobranchus ocellatus]
MCAHRGPVFSYHDRFINYPYIHEVPKLTLPGGTPEDFQPYIGEEREGINVFFTWEMLRPLLRNVTLYVIPNHTIYDPPRLCKYLAEHRITRMQVTPSLMETVINTQPKEHLQESFRTLRHIWFSGEVVTTSLLEHCVTWLPWIRFINMYSVSETHDLTTEDLTEYYNNSKETLMSRKFCPVGQVMKGVEIIIMDKDQNPQPVGKSGEIYVSGPGLAIGYVNRPEVQKYRFIEGTNRNGEKTRLYRSGDWGYMLSDGTLEVCGRVDTMVKIRGYSIEIQAVEACLLSLPMVKSCVVIVCGEEGQDKFLVTYIVSSRATGKKEVREELKKRLPSFMIPSYFVFVQSIPCVAATGKLDKKALPPYDCQLMDGVGDEGRPSTAIEIALAEMWMDVLRLRAIDTQESFFDLGGHSLLAAELLEQARAKFEIDLAVRDLYQYPTVSGLAMLIESRLGNTEAGVTEAQPQRLDLHTEVEKHNHTVPNLDTQLRAFWRTFQHGHHFNRGRVLLTGSTGFLGAFILRELLLQTKLVVYCLTREKPGESMVDRIKAALVKFGIISSDENQNTPEQSQVLEALEARLIALRGIAWLKCDWNSKCDSICRDREDQGFELYKDCREDADVTQFPHKLNSGYAQSKWVAEQLVSKARNKGLPVTIIRPGNVSNSETVVGE